MNSTAEILEEAAHVLTVMGLHTGPQFASSRSDALDVCAAIFLAAEGVCPPEFSVNEVASLAIIEASAPAMTAIKAISDVLDSHVCETEIVPGFYVPDYVEHVSTWAMRPGIGQTEPPTVDEVIGRILRAANTLAIQTPFTPAA